MNKLLSFATGAICGALCGAAVSLLLAPESGEDLVDSARSLWEEAKYEGRVARVEKEQALQAEFEQLKRTSL